MVLYKTEIHLLKATKTMLELECCICGRVFNRLTITYVVSSDCVRVY